MLDDAPGTERIHWDDIKGALYPDTADAEDLSFERVARVGARNLALPLTSCFAADGGAA